MELVGCRLTNETGMEQRRQGANWWSGLGDGLTDEAGVEQSVSQGPCRAEHAELESIAGTGCAEQELLNWSSVAG